MKVRIERLEAARRPLPELPSIRVVHELLNDAGEVVAVEERTVRIEPLGERREDGSGNKAATRYPRG